MVFSLSPLNTSRAQSTDTNYLNIGRNGAQDHQLGEISDDVGGQIPFSKTDGGAAPLRDKIFDYAQLAQYLATFTPPRTINPVIEEWTDSQTTVNEGATCAWYITPDGVHACPNTCPPSEIGTMNGWYKWQSWRVNGAGLFVYWNPYPATPPQQRHIFFGGPGGSSNAWKDWKRIDPKSVEPCTQPQATDFDGMPRTLYQEVINSGHIFIGITPTYGHNVWSMLLRINDILWWLQTMNDLRVDDAVKDAAINGRAYCIGGSWAGFLANMSVLYDPQSIYGAYGGMMLPDFGYEGPQGGWRKLNGHRDAGIGMTVWTTPMRGQDYQFWFAVEQMGTPPDYISEDFSGPEAAGYSLLQRRGSLLREILGVSANVDRHFNHHWSMDILRDAGLSPRTDTWPYYQLMGHAEPGGKRGVNEYWWENGAALLASLLSDTTTQTNPSVPTQPPVSGGQYPNPYKRTLSPGVLDSLPREPGGGSVPFAVAQTFIEANNFGTVPRIGQGVFPGDLDSLKVGDWDGDTKTELIFGNFDGFVHRMEVEVTVGNNVPLLKDLGRSPPLGWGIAALDVTTSPSQVICADSAGHIWRLPISGTGFGQATQFTTSAETKGGSLKHLVVGDFAPNGGKEVFVQDEFQRYLLFSWNGQLLKKSDRTQASVVSNSTISRYTGMTGKPAAINQTPPNSSMELLLPCYDGYLKRLWYDQTAGDLQVHTYPMTYQGQPAHLTATLMACLPEGDQSGNFLVVIGAVGVDPLAPSSPTPDNVVPFLALVRIQGDNAELLDTYADPPSSVDKYVKDPVVTLEWLDGTSFLVGSGNQVARMSIAGDSIVLPANPPSGGTNILALPLPPPPETGPQDPTITPFATARASICAVEVRNSHVFVPLPSGRIFILDKELLQPTRDSKDVEPTWPFLPADEAQMWPNNLTLGWTLGTDQVAGESPIYFLDSKMAFVYRPVVLQSYYRIGAITPGSPATLDEIVSADSKILTTLASEGWNDLTVWKEASTYRYQASVEVGDLWISTEDPELPSYHLFQHFKPWDMPWYDIPGGGYLIRRSPADGEADDANTVLDFPRNFDVTILAEYAALQSGTHRLRGQVTTEHPPNVGLYFGNSLKTADLWVPSASATKSCVVTGTLGGFVYAVDPSVPFDGAQSGLVYETRFDLGWGVTGLDIGDMDGTIGGDTDNEIVVGTWVDDAKSTDDPDLDKTKHCGHVVILNPNPTTGALDKVDDITLDGDPLRGPFATGILGIKIDDIDHDFKNEIWCGDARGYLYLLKRNPTTNAWEAYYRSAAIGAYPGLYNNFHVVKNQVVDDPKYLWTNRLIVFTSGYVYNFQINVGL